eukprot:1195292-Prorocentrum_minimum.AAC.6
MGMDVGVTPCTSPRWRAPRRQSAQARPSLRAAPPASRFASPPARAASGRFRGSARAPAGMRPLRRAGPLCPAGCGVRFGT